MNLNRIRVHLRGSTFPMLSENIGDTVVQSRYDFHNSGLPVHQGAESQHNIGKPQVMYLENMLPMAEGYSSVCYLEHEEDCILEFGADLCEVVRVHRPRNKTALLKIGKTVTVAEIHNRIFMYEQGSPLLMEVKLGDSCGELTCDMVAIPLTCPDKCLVGITATDNRLVLYSHDRLYWGNIETGKEEDFVPSFTNGAGGSKPSQLVGDIVVVYPLAEGLAIYGTHNAVFLEFSNQMHSKYKYSILSGVSGVVSKQHIAYQNSSSFHYVWSREGLALVKPHRDARLSFPDVSEFLAGDVIEDYTPMCSELGIERLEVMREDNVCEEEEPSCSPRTSSSTINTKDDLQGSIEGSCTIPSVCPRLQERLVDCEGGLNVSINLASSRFLCISYGGDCGCVYEYILIWDEALARWGKLKLRHKSVTVTSTTVGSDIILIMLEDGSFVRVTTNITSGIQCNKYEVKDCKSVIVLGRYALDRDAFSEINTIDIQRVHPESHMDLRVYPTFDGTNVNTDTMIPVLATSNRNIRSYAVRSAGLNHVIDLVGTFKLTSLVLGFKYNGRNTI